MRWGFKIAEDEDDCDVITSKFGIFSVSFDQGNDETRSGFGIKVVPIRFFTGSNLARVFGSLVDFL